LKFVPSIIVLLVIYGTTLMSLCSHVVPDCRPVSTCLWVYPASAVQNNTVVNALWSGWDSPAHWHLLYLIQHSTAFALVLYLGPLKEFANFFIKIIYFFFKENILF